MIFSYGKHRALKEYVANDRAIIAKQQVLNRSNTEGDKNVMTVKIRYRSGCTFLSGKTGMPREFEYSSPAFERKHATGVASAGVEGYVEDGAARERERGCSARGWSRLRAFTKQMA